MFKNLLRSRDSFIPHSRVQSNIVWSRLSRVWYGYHRGKTPGLNVARLELKIKALRLNTLHRLPTGEEAHWKHFTSHFLRVSGMQLGKLTLAMDFAPRDIDSDLPAFHRELLCAWINHKCYHERTDVPDSLLDIFEEPLFRNKPLFFRDWVSCGLVRVKDICYEAVPGFLPVRAA